jgi:hypothetical protein
MRTHTNDARSCCTSLRIDSQIFLGLIFGDLGLRVSLGRRASAPSRVNRLRGDWPARRESRATPRHERPQPGRRKAHRQATRRTRIPARRALCGRKTGRTTTAGCGEPTGRACGDRTTRIIIVIISRHVDRGAHPTNEEAGGHVRYADGQQTHRGRGLGAHNDPRARSGRIHRHTRALTHRIMMRRVDQGEVGFVRGQATGEGNWMGKERTIKDDTARGTGDNGAGIHRDKYKARSPRGRRRGDANESQQQQWSANHRIFTQLTTAGRGTVRTNRQQTMGSPSRWYEAEHRRSNGVFSIDFFSCFCVGGRGLRGHSLTTVTGRHSTGNTQQRWVKGQRRKAEETERRSITWRKRMLRN